MTRFLIDMDGVIASWDAEYDRQLDSIGWATAGIPRTHERISFDLNAGRSATERAIIAGIMVIPGFYAKLEPIAGAVAALHEIVAAGHDVRIVTSPWASNPTCASDKLDWVRRHLGRDWGRRVIITNDKTTVRGDILVDDKPAVTGDFEPEWEHVLFNQRYNRSVTDRRVVHNWTSGTWRTVLGLAGSKAFA